MYKQSMAYRVGEQVPNHSDKRQGLIKMLPIQRCLDNLIKKIQHGASDVLIENRSTTYMLRDSIDMVIM